MTDPGGNAWSLVKSMAIPKIILQTFSDWNDLDCSLRKNIAEIQELNKTWEYRFYDDIDICKFITRFYSSDVLSIYERINPVYTAARADFFRYLVMYRFRRCLSDIKSTSTQKLDEVIISNDSYLLSHWNQKNYKGWGNHKKFGVKNEFQQWHIIAAAGHPYLKSVIQRVISNIRRYNKDKHGVGKKAVLAVTGPVAYTLAILAINSSHKHRVVDIEDLGFRYSIFGMNDHHRSLFKNHYIRQEEPLILKRQRRYWFWAKAA